MFRIPRGLRFSVLGFLVILLVAAIALPLAQRVIHGGIPAGALEKARAQATRVRAATRTSATGQLSLQVTATPWQFVGPTNIGGRIVDVAVDPVAPDTIYIAAATGGVWKS